MSVKALQVDDLDHHPQVDTREGTESHITSVEKGHLLVAGVSGIAIVVGIFATDIYLAIKYLR
jgi:hypothetical protein